MVSGTGCEVIQAVEVQSTMASYLCGDSQWFIQYRSNDLRAV